ncbi:hypothetical protein vseg_004399 [Gypsophila vaccaria]
MENVINGFDQKSQIINELLQGLDFAKQLHNQITTNNNKTSSLISDNNNNNNHTLNQSLLLLQNMMSSFDKTLSILNQNPPPNQSLAHVDSPRSKNPSKRRKMMRKWTKTIKVNPDKTISGLEGPLNDGFSWRKYGQKQILSTKYPRNYYRCTHRHTKGCSATKQVQQSDNSPSIYQVMYKGEHTCQPSPNLEQAQIKPISAQAISPLQQQQQISQPIMQEVIMGLSPEEDHSIGPNNFVDKAQIFRSYSFSTALIEAEPLDNYMLSYSPEFASPTTSDSGYFPTLASPGFGLNVQTSDDDVHDPISGPNSVSNSPTMGDFEFSLDQWLDLDANAFEFYAPSMTQ